MTFSALYLLATVISTSFSSYARALNRLAIDYAGARLRISAHTDPYPLAQGGVQLLPGTVKALGPEVMMDGLPGREVMWQ
jgi:hypothetical protein